MNSNVKTFTAIVIVAVIAAASWFYLKQDTSILPVTPIGIADEPAPQIVDSDIALYEAQTIADHIIGNVDAKVTIVEYASLTCPHCANFHTNTFKKFKTNYIDTGKVKFIYRNFHLDNLALAGAMLAQCAPEDQFFAIIDLIFTNQQQWIRADDQFKEMVNILKLIGYSDEKVNECFARKDLTGGLLDDRQRASEEYDVSSTPTIFVNGEKQDGGNTSYEALTATVDALLAN